MSKVRKELLLDTNNNLERPKCIKKEWEVKWRGRERILCEPVRDVGAMHDFDNSFLSPCPRDIRAKDRTGSTEAFRGSLYIREKSMILIVIVARPFTFGWKKDATAKPRSLVFPSLVTDCNMPRIPWRKWLENLLILQQRNLWIFPSWNWRRFESSQFHNSPPLPRFKEILRASKIKCPGISTNFFIFDRSSSFIPSNSKEKSVSKMGYDFSPFLNSSSLFGNLEGSA